MWKMLDKNLPVGTTVVHDNGAVGKIIGTDKAGHYRITMLGFEELGTGRIAFGNMSNWTMVS
jgi:hypothetical protein